MRLLRPATDWTPSPAGRAFIESTARNGKSVTRYMRFAPFPLWFVRQVKGLIQGSGRAKPGILPNSLPPRPIIISHTLNSRNDSSIAGQLRIATLLKQNQPLRFSLVPKTNRQQLRIVIRTASRRPRPTSGTMTGATLQTSLQPAVKIIPKHPKNHQQHQVTQIRAKTDHGKNHKHPIKARAKHRPT